MSKSRVEGFSDGVFAIAITLLVLSVEQPSHLTGLGSELAHRWPSMAAYVVSFAVIGIMWLNHHSIFSHLAQVDRALVYLNLLLLMTVAFLPYPTGILGEALAGRTDTRTAAVFYGVTMTINAVAWTALWLYASGGRRLLEPAFPEGERKMATILFSLGVVIYGASVGVAFANAFVFLAVQAALALYYALDPLTRWVSRRHALVPDP